MRVAVLGSTGGTGRLAVEELLRRGHEVVVLARDPNKLGALAPRVTVHVGDSTRQEALDPLVAGAGAVISALGPTNKATTTQRRTAAGLVAAMNRHGVRRFVGVGVSGLDRPGDQKGVVDRVIGALFRRIAGDLTQDREEELATFAGSDLDWTLARVPRLVDGPASGAVRSDASRPVGRSLRRADLAAFLVDAAERNLYVREAPFVATGS